MHTLALIAVIPEFDVETDHTGCSKKAAYLPNHPAEESSPRSAAGEDYVLS